MDLAEMRLLSFRYVFFKNISRIKTFTMHILQDYDKLARQKRLLAKNIGLLKVSGETVRYIKKELVNKYERSIIMTSTAVL
jgi:uncharacterized protein with HEPN domain